MEPHFKYRYLESEHFYVQCRFQSKFFSYPSFLVLLLSFVIAGRNVENCIRLGKILPQADLQIKKNNVGDNIYILHDVLEFCSYL